jgi:competence protein ComEC
MRLISEITIIFGRRISGLLTIFAIFLFVYFLGFEPTITRAAIMGLMQLIAVYFGRQNWALLSLILAVGTMLIFNPAWIGNLSVQLAFLATLGMILFGRIKKSPISKWYQEIKR